MLKVIYKPQDSDTFQLTIQTETFIINIMILFRNTQPILFLNAQNYGILYVL